MQNSDDNFYIERTFTLPRTSKLTEELVQQLDHMLEYSSPEDYRNTLIEIYHLYIIHEHNTLPIVFERMANHMFFLIEFLKTASNEMNTETVLGIRH
jgi:hypothetical protein